MNIASIIDPQRRYMRIDTDKEFAKVKAEMHKNAILKEGGVAWYQDVYTGKTLRGGDPYDYEHIRSSEELYMKYRDRLTDQQIALVVNCPENVAVTLRIINKSKGKKRMDDWISNPDNVTNHDIDLMLTREVLERADSGIKLNLQKLKKLETKTSMENFQLSTMIKNAFD